MYPFAEPSSKSFSTQIISLKTLSETSFSIEFVAVVRLFGLLTQVLGISVCLSLVSLQFIAEDKVRNGWYVEQQLDCVARYPYSSDSKFS